MMKTYGAAAWQGGIQDGKGAISTRSGALKEYWIVISCACGAKIARSIPATILRSLSSRHTRNHEDKHSDRVVSPRARAIREIA